MSQSLEFHELGAGIRRRWWIPFLLALIGVGVGIGADRNVPVVYRSAATVLVGPTNGAVTHSSTVRASESLATFYADMVRRQTVLQPVVDNLGLNIPWYQLRDQVSAVVPSQNLRLVDVTVLGDTQQGTDDVANAIVEQLVSLSPPLPGGNEQGFVNEQVTNLKRTIDLGEQRVAELQSELAKITDPVLQDEAEHKVRQQQRLVDSWQRTYVELISVEPSSDAGGLTILDEANAVTDKNRTDEIRQAAVGGLTGCALGIVLSWMLYVRSSRRGGGGPARKDGTPAAPDHDGSSGPNGRGRPLAGVAAGQGRPDPVPNGRPGGADQKGRRP